MSNIRDETGINVSSELNTWIDYIFVLEDDSRKEEAAKILEKAYNDWFDSTVKSDGYTILEYLEKSLEDAGIKVTAYIKEDKGDEEL